MSIGLKRISFRLLVFCLAPMLFVGCYPFVGLNPGSSPPPEEQAPEPAGTLLNKEFRIGIAPDYPPLAYTFRGQLVGLEVDFATQLGKDLSKQITLVETPWSELIPALVAGRIDIIMSGMSITADRAHLISFTEPYMRIGQMALVRAKDQANFTNLERFFETTSRVGFVSDTTGEQVAKAIFSKAKLVPQPTAGDGVTALRQGGIDIFVHDAPTIWRIGGNPAERELIGLYTPLSDEPLAWAVRKSDGPLLYALNGTLKEWRRNGQLQVFMSRWISLRISTR
jgi:polar amino acid transport system substrate-binding protein